MEETTPKWLRNKIASNMEKIASLQDQIRDAETERERECYKRWLHQAQVEYAWSEHWITKT